MLPQPFEQIPRIWKHLVSKNNGSLELVRGLTEDTVQMRNTQHTKVLLRLNTLSPLGGAVWGGGAMKPLGRGDLLEKCHWGWALRVYSLVPLPGLLLPPLVDSPSGAIG